MKSKLKKFAQVAGVMLALVFTLSCSSNDDGNNNGGGDGGGITIASFSGTWNASGERSIIFSGNTFEYKINNVTAYYGTFSVSGSSLVYTANTGETASINFQLSGETLVLSNSTGSDKSANGTYTKVGGSGNGGGNGSSIQYQGKTYKTVVIGSQTWMAENLNYNVSGSKCGGTDGSLKDENTVNCDKYGRLYDWSTAMALPGCNNRSCSSQIQAKHKGICPSGWHIPSNAEWDKLMRSVDGNTGTDSPYNSETAGKYLKATSGWNDYNGVSGNGEDTWGFNALPGGSSRYEEPTFDDLGQRNYWQSSSEIDSENAYCRAMSYRNEHAYSYDFPKDRLFSVRCVKD